MNERAGGWRLPSLFLFASILFIAKTGTVRIFVSVPCGTAILTVFLHELEARATYRHQISYKPQNAFFTHPKTKMPYSF
jgi:hypothetical protein